MPGPACYGKRRDAADGDRRRLVLGYIDPDYFLGGTMRLDRRAAAARDRASRSPRRSGSDSIEAAARDPRARDRDMVSAIEEITINQGIDPRAAVLVGGGGAAGLNAVRDRAPARLSGR